jgi:tRNA(Ile)-lysidine synthase
VADHRSEVSDPAFLAELLGRCRFPAAGTAVECAVSGGADSTALMALAGLAGCRVTAVHVDHGLRPGSEVEADRVGTSARRVGASFRSIAVEVEPGPNLEARARRARHDALGPEALLGHTADDQAETLLLNIMRGSGLEGVAAIRPDARHPILALRRAETVAVCAALALDPVDDPTNLDPSFVRNRVRHELLPLLAEVAGRDVVPLLTRLSGHAREAVDHLEHCAAVLDPTDAAALAAAPPVLARVAVRRWLRSCSAEMHPPDAEAVDRVLSVARGQHRATEIGGGWRVARTSGRLRSEPPRRGTDPTH